MSKAIDPINRRSPRNLVIDPNFQFRYALYFAGAGLGAMSILFAVIMGRLTHLMSTVTASLPLEVSRKTDFTAVLLEVSVTTAFTLLVCAIILFGFAFYMSHRVAGAARAIEAYVRDIASGSYDPDRQLRKGDDLQGIMAALRELAAQLKSRSGQK